MSSGIFALLDDVALIARTAAASLDDVAAATVKAGSKSMGIVIDDPSIAAIAEQWMARPTQGSVSEQSPASEVSLVGPRSVE